MKLGDLVTKLLAAEDLCQAHPDTEVVCRVSRDGRWVAVEIADIECEDRPDGVLTLIGGEKQCGA